MVAYSVNLEAHGLTIFAFFDMVGTDIFDSTASQTTALRHENRFEGWGFHTREKFLVGYQPLFSVAAAQHLVFGRNRGANISSNTYKHGRFGKSTT